MKFTIVSAILAAIPAWAVSITNSNFEGIAVGKPFEITWSGAAGAVTLTLKDGPSDNLQTVGQITSGQTGESYTWVPSSSLSTGTYALEINDGTDVNYSQQFEVSGGSASSTSASASSTVSSTLSTSTVSSTTVSSTISSTSSVSSTTSSASESSSSSSSSATTSGSSTSASITSSSASASSTSSASHTSSTTSAATVAPNTNGAQTMAPFVAPMLLAVGAVLI